MVLVVKKATGEILNRCDAWERDADLKMEAWAKENGHMVLGAEITTMGDMVIWVK